MFIYWGSIFVLVFVGVFAEDKSVTVGNIKTQVKGQSGKISVNKVSNESDGVTITYDAIREIDTDGDKIVGHFFQNFASIGFTFSDVTNDTYMNSNVSVTQFSFTSDISVDGDTATLTSFVYIFTGDGNITVDGNDVAVKAGDMKFNAEIVDWPFCAPCRKANKDIMGQYLDFYIEIKGKMPANATDSGSFDLGGGATVITPKQVIFDNTSTEDMPTGYPKLETKDVKQTFIFRFRNFSKSALYDPVVSLGKEGGSDNGGGGSDDNNTTAEDKSIKASGVSLDILGKSGKITLQNEGSTGESRKRISLEFDNLKEKKADGNAVKESSHLLNTFANQEFTFSSVTEGNYPNTSIGVQRITFMSNIKNGATLKIHMYIFKQEGDIRQENETVSVKSGNVKFNIEITGWSFCVDSCLQNEVGKYLDIDIVMKGRSGAASKSNTGSGNTYILGDSGTTILSTKIKVDDSADLVEMEEGYPMLLKQGSKQIFRFRFPKFTSSILYDPTFILYPDSTDSAVKQTMSVFMLVAISFLLYML